MVPLRKLVTPAHVDDDSRALVAQYRRNNPPDRRRTRKLIGVTNPAGLDFHQDFAALGPSKSR